MNSAASARLVAALASSVVLVACGSPRPPACAAGEQALVQDALYFGTTKPDGVVTPDEWARFLADVVTPRFPQGLTTWPASGQWRDAHGTILREPSHVLVIVHAPGNADEAAMREITAAYRLKFKQESVLRVKTPACATF